VLYKLDELDVHVCNGCNVYCSHCSYARPGHSPFEILSVCDYARIIEEAQALGAEDIHLTGGEPTLVNDLAEYISFGTDLGLHLRLISNLKAPDEAMLGTYVDAGLRDVMTSLDGMAKEHEERRRGSSWLDVIEKLRILKRLGVRTRINTVVSHQNMESALSLAKYVGQYGIADLWSCFILTPFGTSFPRQHVVDGRCWKHYLEKLQEIADSYPETQFLAELGFAELDETVNTQTLRGCGAGCGSIAKQRAYLIVRTNGNVFPCVFFAQNSEWSLGNCLSTSLEDVYTNGEWQQYAALTEPPSECIGCSSYPICGGGCRGYSLLLKGCAAERDPRCGDTRPLCPITKINLSSGKVAGSSDAALA
jgi:pyrroloquinoline quinone biosynthesis protein E